MSDHTLSATLGVWIDKAVEHMLDSDHAAVEALVVEALKQGNTGVPYRDEGRLLEDLRVQELIKEMNTLILPAEPKAIASHILVSQYLREAPAFGWGDWYFLPPHARVEVNYWLEVYGLDPYTND